jgi:hypothetical protein
MIIDCEQFGSLVAGPVLGWPNAAEPSKPAMINPNVTVRFDM